ncbi:MAG: alpha/beta hydrolase family protein [Gordonia sp. (in: high G+C Gram-positive bacteria)]
MLIRARKRLVAGMAAIAAVAGVTMAVAPAAHAAGRVELVYSSAMHRNVPVKIIDGGGSRPKPTLYLLDGLLAPNNNSGWLINTKVDDFLADKGVNVAIPFGGAGSFYSDWQQRDPVLGLNRWETFLTRELPAYLKARHNSDNRRNGIAGLSMSGTSALNLASRHPDFYKAVASYSGYPTVTFPGFTQGIQLAVARVGGNPINMWGLYPFGSWFQNDPFLSANKLAGHWVYLSSGGGLGSRYDSSVNPNSPNFNPVRFSQMVPLEVAASVSTELYIARIRGVPGVKLTTHVTREGVHWWDYWQNDFKQSWATTFRPAFF